MAERYVDIDRRTPMLLPVDLREWVAKDTLARLIIDAIEQCDLRRAVTNDRGSGSPQYPPGMMVSLLIYAYAHGVFSSRRIEQLTYKISRCATCAPKQGIALKLNNRDTP